MINPALYQSPRHARLIGMMVVGYGELEITLALSAGFVLQQQFQVLHAIEKIMSESVRINVIDALASKAFDDLGFQPIYAEALGRIRYCLKIRNQYAHAHWSKFGKHLKFVFAEDIFKHPEKELPWKTLPLSVLKAQEAFFINTRKWLMYLEMRADKRTRNFQHLALPERMPRPKLHS